MLLSAFLDQLAALALLLALVTAAAWFVVIVVGGQNGEG